MSESPMEAVTSGVTAAGGSSPKFPPRKRWIDALLPDEAAQLEYAEQRAIVALTERIADLMEEANVSRADLATRMGVSKSRVSRLLAQGNMNLKTLGRVLFALDAEIVAIETIPFGTAPASFEGELDPEVEPHGRTVSSQERGTHALALIDGGMA